MLFLLLCWVQVSFAQSKVVTYETAGSPAKEVLAKIAALTGLEVRASTQTESDLLFVRARGASVDRLLEEIAWSVAGSWKEEGKALVLVRTDKDRAEARQRALMASEDHFQRSLEGLAKVQKQQGNFTTEGASLVADEVKANLRQFDPKVYNPKLYEAKRAIEGKLPATRAMRRLVGLIRARELAELPVEFPVIYSDQPTAMERQLGPAAREVLTQYGREQTLWYEVAAQRTIENPQLSPRVNRDFGVPNFEVRPAYARCLLRLTRYQFTRPRVNATLMILDSEGNIVDSAMQWIGDEVAPKATELPIKDPILSIEPETAEVMGAFREERPLPPQAVRTLLNPLQADPLAYLVGPFLKAYAEAKGANCVVSLQDPSLWVFYSVNPRKTTIRDLENSSRRHFESKARGGWISWRPMDWDAATRGHSDRRLLTEYLRRTTAEPPLTFDEQAYWAYRFPRSRESTRVPGFLSEAVRRKEPRKGLTVGASAPEAMMCLYGSLTADQRAAIRGRGLRAGDLSAEQASFLIEITYATGSLSSKRAQLNPDVLSRQRVDTIAQEMLPNGVHPSTLITLAEVASTLARIPNMGSEGFSIMNVGAVTFARMGQRHPDIAPVPATQVLDLDRIQIGKQLELTFTIQHTEDLYQSLYVQDQQFAAKFYTDAQLPEEFQVDFKKWFDLFSKQKVRPITDSLPPTTNPPPPRR